ncbi:Phosphopantothenate--cysteine ligase [Grifola frondosa]|uniref:Phosphopantothenate--cysteine ligase n=1 Tax=Grifola frondosa TaxID=5627 RepID=A0A1C7LRK7_GRIFR|nr:Phosphopantothenate--cysteine ligase [Grifola frondosa]
MSAFAQSETQPDGTFSAESYFATQPPPPSLEHDIAKVREFVQRQLHAGRKVVLVTSGGTTRAGTLHTLTFVTVNDYLWLLRAVSQELSVLGRSSLYYLAAAVSDFFLPRQKMSVHKIQSGKGSLHIEMDQVPKILKPLVDEWTREGYIVSFKLETDPSLLIPKARTALARYGHQVVIGNDLHRRKHEVVFVSPKLVLASRPAPPPEDAETDDAYEESWLRIDGRADARKEIEEDIVAELTRRHWAWINMPQV